MIINSEFLHNALVFITIIFMVFGTYFLITVGNSKVDEKYKIVFNFHKIKKTTILILILLGLLALFSKYLTKGLIMYESIIPINKVLIV